MTPEELEAIVTGLGTGPRALTEPELQFVTEADRAAIQDISTKHGPDSAQVYAYWTREARKGVLYYQKAGLAASTQPSPQASAHGRVGEHRGQGIDLESEQRAAVARIQERLIKQGKSEFEAGLSANRQVNYWMDLPRTAEGKAQSLRGADPASALETSGMSDLEVYWEALKPQRLPTQKAQKEDADVRRRASWTRNQMWQAAYETVAGGYGAAATPVDATTAAYMGHQAATGGGPGDQGPRIKQALANMSKHGGGLFGHLRRQGFDVDTSLQLTQDINRAHRSIVNTYLEDVRGEFDSEALANVRQMSKESGQPLSHEEEQAQAKYMGEERYNIYVAEVFPSIAKERADVVTEEDVERTHLPWVDAKSAAKHLTMQNYLQRARKGEEGPLMETYGQTGMRDLAGLIRLATDPVIDAISYEVDEHGKPVDTSDWNYRFAMAHNDLLAEGGVGAFLGTVPFTMFPSTFVRDPYAGAERDKEGNITALSPRMRISTGNWIRDVAVSTARGRYLGDDFMELGETTAMYSRLSTETGLPWIKEAPMFLGLAVEIGLPITPLPIVGGATRVTARATAATVRASANTLGAASRIVDTTGVARDYMKAVGSMGARPFEFAASPTTWARQQTIYRDAMAAIKSTGKKPKLVERVSIMDEARLPNAVATRVASDMADAHVRGVPRGMGVREGTGLSRTWQLLEDADRMLLEGLADAKVYNKMKADPLGQAVIDNYLAARMAGFKTGTGALRKQVLTNVVKDSVKETFAHSIPNNYILVSENAIVPVKTWNKVKGKVQAKASKILDNTPVGDEVLYSNGPQVAKLLSDVLGHTKVAATPFWAGVRAKLLNSKPLTWSESTSVHNMAVSGIVKGEVTGSVVLKYAGEAYKTGQAAAARAEKVVREPLIRSTKEVLAGARDTLFRAKGRAIQVESHASVEVQGLVNTINNRLTQLDREYIKYVAGQRKLWGNDTTKGLLDDLGSGNTVDDLLDIVKVFFGQKALKPVDMAGLRVVFESRFANRPLTEAVIIESIAEARSAHPVLSRAGVKSQGLIPYAKESVAEKLKTEKALRTDEPDVAVHAWLMDKYKSRVMEEVLTPFYAKNPELLIRMGGDDVADADRFRAIARSMGVPVDIVNKVVPVIYRGLGDASALEPAHFHQLIEDIFSDLFNHGTLPHGTSPSLRTGEAITNRLLTSQVARVSSIRKKINSLYPNLVLWQRTPLGNTQDLINKTLSVMIEASTGSTMNRLVGQLRSMGVSIPAKGVADLGDSLKPMVLRLESDIAVLAPSGLLTTEEINTARQLLAASASGKLWQNLQDLEKVDSILANQIGNSIKNTLDLTRRMAVSGLLGGFPLPGVRHGSLNAVSAPFIFAVTQPKYVFTALKTLVGNPLTGGVLGKATFRALERAMGQSHMGTKVFNLAHSAARKGPNDVVMIDKWGRKWTKSRLRESMEKQNIMFTQTQFEFRDKVMDDIRRTVATTPGLRKASWVKQAWRYLNPANKNLWGMLVEETDIVFREAAYAEALRRGLTETQAAVIARNVLLDYGALFAWERSFASRAMLFYAFQRQMTLEVLKSFLRNGDSRKILRGTVAGIQAQHQEAGVWMFEPDYMRSRLWSYIGKDFDEVHTAHAGADIPSVATFNMLMNTMFVGLDFTNSMASEDGETRYMPADLAKGFFEEFQATPALSALFDLAGIRGPPTKDQRDVKPEWAKFFMDAGVWDEAVWAFNIKKHEKLPGPRPGTPTIDGETYYFGGAEPGKHNGYQWWLLFEYATLIGGVQRNIREYTTLKMKTGDMPEDTELKYMGEGNWVLYSLALDTSYKLPTEAQVHMRSAAQIQQELRALK